jgi:hypothetical protein
VVWIVISVLGELPLGELLFHQLRYQSLLEVKVLPTGLQKLVNSQITSGDHMQTLSKGYQLPSGNLSRGFPLPL